MAETPKRYPPPKPQMSFSGSALRKALCELGNAASEGSVKGISYIGRRGGMHGGLAWRV